MANCPHISQEKSGPVNGWYCIQIGGYADHSLYTNYCNSSVNNQHCPHNGGDDRIRNPDSLKEEICASICQSVQRNLENGAERMHSFFQEFYSLVSRSDYVDLCRRIEDTAKRPIQTPSVSGRYFNLVQTDVERERARKLESDLYETARKFQPSQYAGGFYVRGDQLEIGEQDFQEIAFLLRRFRSEIGEAITGNVDAGGIEKYAEPARNLQDKLKNAVAQYMQEIQRAADESQIVFERGCSFAFGSMGKLNFVPPKVPEWGDGQ